MEIGQSPKGISIGRRLSMLAEADPEKVAIVYVPREGDERRISRHELDRASNPVARLLEARGVNAQSMIVIGLRNCPEHYVASFGAWKLGACVLPLSPALPAWERDQILEVVHPAAIVTEWDDVRGPIVRPADLLTGAYGDGPLPDRT